MGVLGQVILIVCVLIVWVAGLYRYEKGQARAGRRRTDSSSREAPATGNRSLSR
jgi:hypothetical protein